MKTYKTRFLLSAPNASVFPVPDLPEIAVVGRSNSGKSTLINILVGQRGLAKVSGKPGRTRAINFFEVEERYQLVDLPGYGFASGPKNEKVNWGKLVGSYFASERPLKGVLALFDIRRQPNELDKILLTMFRKHQITWQAIWTKADKIKKSQLAKRTKELNRLFNCSAAGIAASSKSRLGRDEILEWIEQRVLG
ncbi:MAG: YihA family ribosome biogenesis GTP-binding protein [Deltaproteobacteria bacterium]|nr:YihA family ribosome biogenesis GTP-binding protein [Deltaproteobacteria bacterium]